jgi:DNA-directed RNA polymerase specialized sigma24 family protein
MGKEWSIDRIIVEGLEKKTGAFTPSQQEEINAWLERLGQEAAEQEAAQDEEDEAERQQKKKKYDAFVSWYGVLSAEQFIVRLLRTVGTMNYAQIAKRTGKSQGAVRTINCRALKNLERKSPKIALKRRQKRKKP